MALAALEGNAALNQLAQRFDAHANHIVERRRQLVAHAAEVFADGIPREAPINVRALHAKRRLDELHLELPFAGSRMLRDLLRSEAVVIGREHLRTLMRRMGITAIYRRPKTTRRHRVHPVLPLSPAEAHARAAESGLG